MNTDDLKRLAKELPVHVPDADRSDLLRAKLLQAAEQSQPRPAHRTSWARGVAIVAIAAAAAFYIGLQQGDHAQQATQESSKLGPLAALSSPNGASFDHRIHSATRDGKDIVVEEVRLHQGRLAIDLQGLRDRELVLHTSDARVLGDTSTLFSVSVEADKLQSVEVSHGQIQIELENQPAIILGPGQSWVAPITETVQLAVNGEVEQPLPAELSESVPAPELAPPIKRPASSDTATPEQAAATPKKAAPTPEEAAARPEEAASQAEEALLSEPEATLPAPKAERVASAAELAFDAGYLAVKAGDYKKAILELDRAISEGSDDAMRGDARYWRSIALARAGRKKEAMRSLSEFLSQHGESSRAGEVATMLGWFYVDEGLLERAAGLFEQARDDLSPRVRASARAGIKAIADAQP